MSATQAFSLMGQLDLLSRSCQPKEQSALSRKRVAQMDRLRELSRIALAAAPSRTK